MAENENTVVEETAPQVQPQPTEPSKGKKVGAAVKEWFRKQTVKLKRNTKIIPQVYLVIIMVIWLIWLFTFSQAIDSISKVEWIGMLIFIITLLSILAVALFGSAFPKRKKTNIVMLCLLFVFLAVIILCSILYYTQAHDYIYDNYTAEKLTELAFLEQSLNLAIANAILNGIGIVLLATLPLYTKLIKKINTRKVLEESQLSNGAIDTSAEV
ncbi:MAG: hypothetical protein J1G05_05860 [Clostridiales bacterium]|nr:hypothetical protein [Clostridiales bacterium]